MLGLPMGLPPPPVVLCVISFNLSFSFFKVFSSSLSWVLSSVISSTRHSSTWIRSSFVVKLCENVSWNLLSSSWNCLWGEEGGARREKRERRKGEEEERRGRKKRGGRGVRRREEEGGRKGGGRGEEGGWWREEEGEKRKWRRQGSRRKEEKEKGQTAYSYWTI